MRARVLFDRATALGIVQTAGKILVDADGTLTIEARPDDLLGLDSRFAPLACWGKRTRNGTVDHLPRRQALENYFARRHLAPAGSSPARLPVKGESGHWEERVILK